MSIDVPAPEVVPCNMAAVNHRIAVHEARSVWSRSFQGLTAAGAVAIIALFIACGLSSKSFAQPKDANREKRFDEARLRMVEFELVREGISNKSVLESMRQVKRTAHLPSGSCAV